MNLYRGTTLFKHEIPNYKNLVGREINFSGFASTTSNKEVALDFATKYHTPDKVPAIFHICLCRGTKEAYSFRMNHPDFTEYPNEEEVLLDDGRPFKVLSVSLSEEKVNDKDKGQIIVPLYFIRLESRRRNQICPDVPGYIKAIKNIDLYG